MEDFEKLGVFYLGRPYDPVGKKQQGGVLLYDSRDLLTHAICVGMTGSGKTGLCISLLEEAALDNIPAIAIDPKGDLTNLLLNFPDLKGEDFQPWVNEEDALKKGISVAEFARQQAELWRNGLAAWNQSGERIRKLRQATDMTIYTPGSTAGLPVSIMKSFAAPPRTILEDAELFRERINTTTSSLLGIIGIEGDPIKSREHILIATCLGLTWKEGKAMDIATLIQQIQTPPVARIGVLDINSFYPAKDRFTLALALNNLLAAPGFNPWLEGEALEIDSILHTAGGKPRIAIFSIAHLNDAERMFFVSLLLNQVLGWMRTQSGTTSLRALLFMDEIFGFFPPVANPPSKIPLLSLLKQARAFGLGIVLATQNPVDLDYKGLSNTGTWFIGRLQTERDKARLMEGLEGVAASNGMKWDRQGMEQTLAGLSNRIFLMHNVHDDEPIVFETRWAMSYLRGPLTRNQIKRLMDPIKATLATPPNTAVPVAPAPVLTGSPATSPVMAGITSQSGIRPVIPPGIPQYFIPVRHLSPVAPNLYYQPVIIGAGSIIFSDSKTGTNTVRDVNYRAVLAARPIPVDWPAAVVFESGLSDLLTLPREPARFGELPEPALKTASYGGWSREFAGWLCQNEKLDLWKSPGLKDFSRPGESERDFRVRLGQQAREQRDAAADKLRQKYAPKFTALEEQERRARANVEKEKEQARQQQLQTAITFGSTLLKGFLGRKATSTGRATASGISRSMKESGDIRRAEETVAAIQRRQQQLETEFQSESAALAASLDPLTEKLEIITIRPSRSDVTVKLLALGWLPYWQSPDGKLTPAF